jgi:hypothetical protein
MAHCLQLTKVVKQRQSLKVRSGPEPRTGLAVDAGNARFRLIYIPVLSLWLQHVLTTLIDAPEPNSIGSSLEIGKLTSCHKTWSVTHRTPSCKNALVSRKLAETQGSVNYRTLDARQQAIKTVNNSFYGLRWQFVTL